MNSLPSPQQNRETTYYWKCDRPSAFHGITHSHRPEYYLDSLRAALLPHFKDDTLTLSPAGGEGNHITFVLQSAEAKYFVRVEDGPEGDNHLKVESSVMTEVRKLNLPVPEVLAVDVSRETTPYAWQVLEYSNTPDLNQHFKAGTLDSPAIAVEIGSCIAQWQALRPPGFGPFNPDILQSQNRLEGFHSSYEKYFFLHLERHLHFLVERAFITRNQAEDIDAELHRHRGLLSLDQGCLVHKDLALWNIMGTNSEITAFIDWDDAICGDSMDDLSLLACFHDARFMQGAFEGYQRIRDLPTEHRRRFWLHLLRNMIVKTVIRVGAGYFERNDGFFLIGAGTNGENLSEFTKNRIHIGLAGLKLNANIDLL